MIVDWPEHASFAHVAPQDDDVLLESSRSGNRISGPSLLHRDGGQFLKKSWSSQAAEDVAMSAPGLTRQTTRAVTRNILIFLLLQYEMDEGDCIVVDQAL
ncbi:hypothetical protein CFC21_032451 [Triticum aestivum]|uniref:Uncharacterized protein n=2 Tax=Triticum aestivum TaxID=4565 RepID=A0A3B6DMX6_WHEAT|nr:hypothetical protein CFC21_032451 [Triticum aestivum]